MPWIRRLSPPLKRDLEPLLKRFNLPLLGVLPRSPLLRSVSVRELSQRLNAEVLCCPERLDLLVETLSIGAMSVNSAMQVFRRRRNMAVVDPVQTAPTSNWRPWKPPPSA